MKAINYNKKTTASIVLAYLVLVFVLAVVLTSCSVVAREGGTSPCATGKYYSGYSAGHTKVFKGSNRHSF